MAHLVPLQAGLNVIAEDMCPKNLTLHNASDESSVRIVYGTDDNDQAVLFTNLNVKDGQIKAKLNDGSDATYSLFGHDNLSEKTFGEMSLTEKNTIAHRARALEKFKTFLKKERIVE